MAFGLVFSFASARAYAWDATSFTASVVKNARSFSVYA